MSANFTNPAMNWCEKCTPRQLPHQPVNLSGPNDGNNTAGILNQPTTSNYVSIRIDSWHGICDIDK